MKIKIDDECDKKMQYCIDDYDNMTFKEMATICIILSFQSYIRKTKKVDWVNFSNHKIDRKVGKLGHHLFATKVC